MRRSEVGGDDVRVTLCGPADLTLISARLRGGGPPSPGYRAPIISQLALGLVDRGHDVDLVTLSPDPADRGTYAGERLRVHVGRYRPRRRWVDAFRAERQAVAEFVAGTDADVVHAHWTYEFALGALREGRPTVITIRDWAPTVLRHQPDPYRAVRLLMQARVLRSGRHFTANSPYLVDRAGRWARAPIALVPNGTSFPDTLRAQRHGTGVAPVVIAVANGFGSRKNVGSLLRAFPAIRRAHPGAVLRLVGSDFEPGGPAAAWAGDRGLAAGVDFVGPVPAADVRGVIARASVFVHPSFEETFGQVLVEAAAAGTPIVAGRDAGAVPWVLGAGRAGRLVDVGRPEAIAASVVELLDAPDEAAELAQRAFDECSHRFSITAMLSGYEERYLRAQSD